MKRHALRTFVRIGSPQTFATVGLGLTRFYFTSLVLRISANVGDIVAHRTETYWISLVRTGSYCFVLVLTSYHRVRIASQRIRIDSPI